MLCNTWDSCKYVKFRQLIGCYKPYNICDNGWVTHLLFFHYYQIIKVKIFGSDTYFKMFDTFLGLSSEPQVNRHLWTNQISVFRLTDIQ